jgi:DNA-binding NarL/FixJ family response regulator
MIHLFAVCKNDFFIKALSVFWAPKEVVLVNTCKQPGHAVKEFSACSPIPDIILLDANWPNGNNVTRNLIHQFLDITISPPKIILVTNFCEEKAIEELKPCGAHGYFYRASAHSDTIFQCIRTVYNGGKHFQQC